MDCKVDGKATPVEPQLQEAAATKEGLGVFGMGSSCGIIASTTGSRSEHQEEGKEDGLLRGGLAVALSGHWRTAEMQFVDTARRVRSKFRSGFGRVLIADVCLTHTCKKSTEARQKRNDPGFHG